MNPAFNLAHHVRLFSGQPRVYVDLDGVTADFLWEAHHRGIDPSLFELMAGAFASLPIFPGAQEAILALQKMGFEVFFLSRIPAHNPYAATEKLLWVQKHFPNIGDHVIIGPDKGALGRPGDFLVDDHPEWSNCAGFGGQVVAFQGDWTQTLAEIAQRRLQ